MMYGKLFYLEILNLFFPPTRKHIEFPLITWNLPSPPACRKLPHKARSQNSNFCFQTSTVELEDNNKIISFNQTKQYFLLILNY